MTAIGGNDEENEPDKFADEPVRYVLRITDEARTDIADEWDRLAALVGESIADDWQRGLLQAIGRLNLFPNSYPLASEEVRAVEGGVAVRQMIYRRTRKGGRGGPAHHVLYVVDDPDEARQRGDTPAARVLHVYHAARGS